MTLAEMIAALNLTDLITGGSGITLLLMTIIQITPVKLNPWSVLAKSIGKAINGEIFEKLDDMDHAVKDLRSVCDEREATLRRTHILHFNDEILHQVKHTKEHFDQILEDIDYYEDYCDKHPEYKNNKAVCAIDNIRHTYQKCMDEHDFL